MTITISVFWIVLLIFIVHTVLQHLINWMWRAWDISNDESVWFAAFGITILEVGIVIGCLGSVL